MSGKRTLGSLRRPHSISSAAVPWSAIFVLSERMMAVCCIRAARLGKSSLMWMPGTSVGIARNGPPVFTPGFGSHVSNWLAPPASQRRITRRSCFRSSAASAGDRSMPIADMSATGGAAAPTAESSRRREMPASGLVIRGAVAASSGRVSVPRGS